MPTDYVPQTPDNLIVWVDAGDGSTSAPRADGNGFQPRAGNAFQLLPRRPQAALTPLQSPAQPSAVAFATDGSTFAVGQQNGRNVLTCAGDATGLTGTWGSFGPSWTLMAFFKAEATVDDYAGVTTGHGAMSLVSSPSVGITVQLPSGGAVPLAATVAGGGPLDGVTAGVPWDVVFFNQWRQLTVINNATTGQRIVLVDGYTAGTVSAKLDAVPSSTPVAFTQASFQF
jgi:hypothetical protein